MQEKNHFLSHFLASVHFSSSNFDVQGHILSTSGDALSLSKEWSRLHHQAASWFGKFLDGQKEKTQSEDVSTQMPRMPGNVFHLD